MSIPIADYPRDRYGLIRRAAAQKIGITDDELGAAVKRSELVRLTRGVFMVAPPETEAQTPTVREEEYRLRCIAAATSARTGEALLSHTSAAALHGLPLLTPDRGTVHLTRRRHGGGSVRDGRHRHPGPVPAEDVVEIDGLAVTSLRRTVLDVARAGTFAQALTAVDGGLARGLTRDELTAGLAGRATGGIGTARRAVVCGNRLAESPGESWSRAQMIAGGLPVPQLQRRHTAGSKEYRVDFDWDGVLVGEFDGLVKYRGRLRPGETPNDAVIREKLREDALRNEGIAVIRWTWRTLERGEMVTLVRSWLVRTGVLSS
ncbi:hypothetical protein [Gordonia caeni]|uniref:Type IV toxin-antitoxin system AbiEi family antitoxin domain-containing protein n=1 Tax=Gordonia caeni TaxID=1007097 RepID=A0ABP7NXH4_9ACTN